MRSADQSVPCLLAQWCQGHHCTTSHRGMPDCGCRTHSKTTERRELPSQKHQYSNRRWHQGPKFGVQNQKINILWCQNCQLPRTIKLYILLCHMLQRDMITRRREDMNNVSWGGTRYLYSSCPVYMWRLGSVAMVAFNGLILRNATNCNSSTPQLHNIQLDWLSHCMSPRSYICFLCPSQDCKPDGPPPGPYPLQVSMLRSNSRTKYHC